MTSFELVHGGNVQNIGVLCWTNTAATLVPLHAAATEDGPLVGVADGSPVVSNVARLLTAPVAGSTSAPDKRYVKLPGVSPSPTTTREWVSTSSCCTVATPPEAAL